MKKKIAISVILSAVLLAGCSANTPESSAAQTESRAQTTEESVPTEELTAPTTPTAQAPTATVDTAEPESPATAEAPDTSAEFALIGPGGDRVTAAEITRVDASDEEDYIANGISATNWRQAEVNGFTYLAEPGGEYHRVSIGEEICGLTLFNANCVFNSERDQGTGEHADEGLFSSSYAEFEGTVRVSGTLSTAPEDIGLVDAGSVLFTPDDGTQLPIMNYLYSAEQGVYYPEEAVYPLIAVTGVTPQSEGEQVTLLLSGISASSSVNGYSVLRAAAEIAE